MVWWCEEVEVMGRIEVIGKASIEEYEKKRGCAKEKGSW